MNQEFANKVAAWVNGHENGRYDTDGVPSDQPYQCVDLVQVFNSELVGGPRFWGNAKDIINQPGDKYRRINNTPDFVPQAGDIGVFNGNLGGGYGHVVVCTGLGDTNTFQSLDQNWNRPEATRVTHNYNNFIGVLRPLVSEQASAQPAADNQGIVQGDHLRIHAGPSLSSPTVGYHDDQERVTLVSRAQGDTVVGKWGATPWWYQIEASDGAPAGWVTDGYVLTTANPANVPDYAPAAPEPAQYSKRPDNGKFIIDISSFQGDVDFTALKGVIDGVIIRAGHFGKSLGGGEHNTDQKLAQNRDKAREVGIARGFYWYGYPALDAKAEAADFVASVGLLQPGESLWLDLEEKPDPGTDVGKWCSTFLDEAERLSGRTCHLYTYQNYAENNDLRAALKGERKLWLANYNNTPGLTTAIAGYPAPVMHQYTSSGSLAGIAGNVDLSVLIVGELPDYAQVIPPSVTPPTQPTATTFNQDDRNLLLEIRQLLRQILDKLLSVFK